MKSYFKYIFLTLISLIAVVSCLEEMDMPQSITPNESLTLVPRVKSFANQYITKSTDINHEQQINNICVLIFNNDGNLVSIQEEDKNLLTISKTALRNENVSAATIVMFANIGLANIKDADNVSIKSNYENGVSVSLSDMEAYYYDFSDKATIIKDSDLALDTFAGFPMVGGVVQNLTATSEQQEAISVSLKILYSKVNFEIAVDNVTENQDISENGVSFNLHEYSIFNVPKTTSLAVQAVAGDNKVDFLGNSVLINGQAATYAEDTATSSSEYVDMEHISKSGSSNIKTPDSKATFTFYIAENHYNHNCTLADVYPSAWDDLTKYEHLKQQYKPLIAESSTADGEATYVVVNGTYNDYRGTAWTVNYTIYLGKDNKENFHVDRNSEYTNILTIKGIRNNDGYGEGDVWIDHRVDVSTTDLSSNVTITRETLIDSHIEVRPLRVKWEGDTYAGVRVYLPTDDSNGKLLDWIGMERFTGENCLDGSTYCYVYDSATKQNVAIGKRKYFTTTLISELQSKGGEFGVQVDNGKKFIYLLNGECVWIYFDEHTGNTDRDATFRLEFYSKDGKTISPEEYLIKQRALQTIEDYAIESYEEYLHTYDSADKYNLSTSPSDYTQQGIAWGLNNKTLSGDVIVTSMQLTPINIPVFGGQIAAQEVIDQRYDFFHNSDIPQGVNEYYIYTKNNGAWDVATFQTGLDFTNRATTPKEGVREGITIKDMGTIPDNAYQYCLSKNKFTEDTEGNHTLDIHWYLPDIYELKTVLGNVRASADFKDGVYYWSSQPSFTNASDISEYILGAFGTDLSIKEEVPTKARALYSQFGDSNSNPSDIERNNKNRIRCFYSAEGIKNVDMSERVPDGLGGNFTFWMKGWTDGSKSTAGFFNYLLPSPPTPTGGEPETSDIPDVTFPTKNNSQGANVEFPYIVMQGKNGQIEGFEKDPGAVANWREYSTVRGYYYVLTTYPGLTEFTLTDLPDWQGVRVSKPTETRKAITQISTKTSKVEKTQSLPSTLVLNPLDTKLKISFSKANGNTAPLFTYDELYSRTKTTSTQYWNKPIYASTTHELNPESQTSSSQGSGSETGISTGTSRAQEASVESAKKVAFDGTRDASTTTHRVDGAYPKAKSDAKGKLDELLKAYPTSDGWVHGSYNYTSLSWNQEVSNIQWSKPDVETGSYWTLWDGTVTYTKKVTITCTVTLTGSITVTKPGSKTLFLQTEGTGTWTTASSTTENSGPTVNTDELRMYCGNSFTISVTDANYEISKVKVYFKNGNEIKTTTIPVSSTYARFVDSTLIPTNGSNIIKTESKDLNFESVDVIQLNGMDYSANSKSGEVWQQWSGNGRSSVTLVLADYHIQNGDWTNWTESEYTYKIAETDLSKYFVIEKIEVKCIKKASSAQ